MGSNEMMSVRDLAGRTQGLLDMERMRPVVVGNVASNDPMVTNATLRKNEWERIDEKVNAVMRERLTIVDDVRSRGLVTPVSLGTILRVTERLEEWTAASVSYDGDTSPTRDRPTFLRDTTPVPVISHGFRIGWRQLDSSRTRGEPLDMTGVAAATRKVRDKLQDLFINGLSHGPDGSDILGLTNATYRQTVSLSTDWDASGSTIIDDVKSMLDAAYDVNLFGPFFLYVPKNYWGEIQQDYNDNKGDRTYMERIEAFEDIEKVRPLDTLTDDNVLLVQMTEDVLDLSEAVPVTTVQWEINPFVTEFRVLTVAGPHLKSMESSNESLSDATIHGIVHLS